LREHSPVKRTLSTMLSCVCLLYSHETAVQAESGADAPAEHASLRLEVGEAHCGMPAPQCQKRAMVIAADALDGLMDDGRLVGHCRGLRRVREGRRRHAP
jgi:hypothetical protein